MDNKKTSQEPRPESAETQRVELALLVAQSYEPMSHCPDPEETAALSEGRIRGARREELIAHLAQCESCRAAWSLAATLLGERAAKNDTPQRSGSRLSRRFMLTTFAPLALAAGVLLAVFLPGKNSQDALQQSLENVYAIAGRPQPATRGGEAPLLTEWDSALARVARLPAWSSTQQAYAAGTLQARSRLEPRAQRPAGPDVNAMMSLDWNNTPDALYFSLGQWTRAVRNACSRAAVDPEDNAALRASVESFRKAFGADARGGEGSKAAQTALAYVSELMDRPNGLACGALREAFDRLDATLAPFEEE